jgi:5-methylcytosine-specific restriction protein B
MDYFDELKRFLAQAKTDNLKTAHFRDNFQGLKVKVSFGKGNPARVPWIAFLAKGQHISNGIYPFFLFYKNLDLLILALGISETLSPAVMWDKSRSDTIRSYFKTHQLGKPPRYGDSLVYRAYDAAVLDPEQVERDLAEVLEIYSKSIGAAPEVDTVPRIAAFDYHSFQQKIKECGLQVAPDLTLRFIASLLAKPFVILTGLSGSGKTKLAQAFAHWISGEEEQVCMVAVGADWTNREPLLGYPNALEAGKYVKPEAGTLDLLLAAGNNPDKPYFLILDEMNLSHVERYFADFLSAMESGEYIRLHPIMEEALDGVPARVRLPSNLFIIGTVNIDETTYMFSPKVLDRANVIEFSISGDDMLAFLQSGSKPDVAALPASGSGSSAAFMEIPSKHLESKYKEQLADALVGFFVVMKSAGAEFGYRSATEILRFAAIVNHLEPDWDMHKIMDAAIMQKLLPKIHGPRRKLESVLKALGRLCLEDPTNLDDYFNHKKEETEVSPVHYPLTLEKLRRMYKNLLDHGFTSFAEA